MYSAAIKIAREYHKGQTYSDGNDYVDAHLLQVAFKVAQYTKDEDVITAAILHDIIEDTEMTKVGINFIFGPVVADLVWRVSNESGANRKERHLKTYPKIAESDYAILIKLCDRYINTRANGKRGMYLKEYPEFKQALYNGTWIKLWIELEAITYGE